MVGRHGRDNLIGLGGDDRLCGDRGNDFLDGDDGRDPSELRGRDPRRRLRAGGDQRRAVEVDEHRARQNLRLVESLEDHDDVQRVTANFDIPEELFAEVAG